MRPATKWTARSSQSPSLADEAEGFPSSKQFLSVYQLHLLSLYASFSIGAYRCQFCRRVRWTESGSFLNTEFRTCKGHFTIEGWIVG